MSVEILVGDALSVLRTLPGERVHCCVTSPPYFGLRDYGVAGQIGLEPTPEAYVSRMVEVFREVRRVLRADGTLWLNIGDSYAGTWGNQGRKGERGTQRQVNGEMLTPVHDGRYPQKASHTGTIPKGASYKAKDLLGIPWMLAFALRDDGWYLRRDIIWHKPNPMPESVTDRPTSAHEYLFLLTKSARYFYDAEAIKEENSKTSHTGGRYRNATSWKYSGIKVSSKIFSGEVAIPRNGRNKRSVWTIATAPFRGAHFATFPPALVEPCILAGTSARGVCPKCGAPWEMVIRKEEPLGRRDYGSVDAYPIGWRPTCDHAALNPVRATVLDPFFGAGTTGLIAQQQGRDCIGIELNTEYAAMARRRIDGKITAAAA